jgi:homoserine dehydrogenase
MRLAFLGFGNVGRRFAELLGGPYGEVLRARGEKVRVTGIATGRHGLAIDPRGLDLGACLARVGRGESLDALHRGRPVPKGAFLDRVPADVLFEITPLDPRRGEPATAHCRKALSLGLHVVTANKGPVAFAYRSLRGLAERKGVSFRHEGAVMDGVPVFNLVERCLPGNRIHAFRGTLNSTTSHVLSRLAEGWTLSRAVAEAKRLGIAEADPSNDLDGWDAAVKGCALANVLMGGSVRPSEVRRRGISGLLPARVRRDARQGFRWRLVVEGRRRGRKIAVRVFPARLPAGDPLAGSGGDAALLLETSLVGTIGVLEGGGTIDQTAYALFSDLLAIQDLLREGVRRAS